MKLILLVRNSLSIQAVYATNDCLCGVVLESLLSLQISIPSSDGQVTPIFVGCLLPLTAGR
jgi:hypothetical protein